ncbi:NAD+ synthase [Telmatospirillum sp. J64-1]|uniref:NAD+ synthase n=1 Tax=Telmatospirillum sp. J64-1 TaxID=2502183 RepID=UPI00115D0D15|nr:NAD+ synthase [Telmatospirillum sp. J64-1]
MTDTIRIAFAQINPVVGDVAGNVARIRQARAQATEQGAELVICGELTLSGYPPEDLVLKNSFLARIREGVEELAAETADGGPALLVGAPWLDGGKRHNAVLLLDGGRIAAVRYKHHLPNYGVFDEVRVFEPGPCPGPMAFRGLRLGVMICEDMWFPDVTECLEESGAEMLVVVNGSPFETDKSGMRQNHAVARVTESGLPLLYVNQVGGQDELVFDGASFALDARCRPILQMPAWVEAVETATWTRGENGWTTESTLAPPLHPLEDIYQAMMLGLRDYVTKNRFPGVLLGLSGGIDSALSAAVAVDALGADKVHCVMMPSPYTSQESLDDAEAVARMLGTRYDIINIEPAMGAFGQMLSGLFAGTEPGITEENLQSRSRGITLMAISNKFGHMVLSTGNKSEMSTGYATLYGDMCGGYSVLKDVYKTTVFDLCRWRNQAKPAGALGPDGLVMPDRVITKPPSAELKPDQRDQDSLPPYEVLDAILSHLIEDELGVSDVVAKGFEEALVRRVWRMLDLAEYKRRQAPPGVKITSRAFGRDRRYPITNAFTRNA